MGLRGKHKSRNRSVRKRGRNLAKCARYKSFGRREENKRRKLLKHLAKHPDDKVAKRAFKSV